MDDYLEILYKVLLEGSDDYIYINDCSTGLFRYSPTLVKMFALPGEIVKDPLKYWKNIVHPNDWEKFFKANQNIVNNRTEKHLIEFRAKKRDGEYVWLRCRGKLIRNKDKKPLFFAGTINLLGKENKIDPLTQLLNRSEFNIALERNIKNNLVKNMAVIMIDIDEFRQINEIYGRDKGDQILKSLSTVTQSILRQNATLFRLEKDKMGILMKNCKKSDVEQLYLEIQKELLKGNIQNHIRLDIEISAGCSMYPLDGVSAEDLYQYTEYALQSAKEQGKNRLVFFTEEILNEKKGKLDLLCQLRDDMKEGYNGFFLNYQPQIQHKTGKLIGVEVLMRWRNKDGNLVSPMEFIPILEKHGLMYQVGIWLLRTALRETKEWVLKNPDFSISINVSVLQLLDDKFLNDLYMIIEEEDFPPENLIIEMTESYVFKNINLLQKIFNDIRKRKIRVALDDFGTGYSSLYMLKNSPVDIVKIDRAFVKDITNSEFDLHFIRLVVDICHTVSIEVCLEGIEKDEEYEILKNIPLDILQGYYFEKPMSKDKITELYFEK